MSTDHPDSLDHSVRGSARRGERTGREVICKICQAVYVPARTHRQLARSPHAVIESAFVSMCHFCFRCRRPACPSCWDDVHGVCGACALEAQLPFRSSVPPLEGMVVSPVERLPLVRVRTVTPPLVCVRPGRFQRSPLPIEAQTTLYVPTISDQSLDAASKPPPSRQTPLPSAQSRPRAVNNVANVVTQPEKRRVRRNAALRHNKLARAVMAILLFSVLVIAGFTVSALLFPSVNDGSVYVLHVDIRAQIAYLLEMIQHLF